MQQFLLVQVHPAPDGSSIRQTIRFHGEAPAQCRYADALRRKAARSSTYIGVMQPSGRVSINSAIPARFAAVLISSTGIRRCNTNIFRDRRVKPSRYPVPERDTLMQFRKADLLNQVPLMRDLPFCRRIKPPKADAGSWIFLHWTPRQCRPVPFLMI